MDEKGAVDDACILPSSSSAPVRVRCRVPRMRVDAMVENDREHGDATDPVETAKSTRRRDWRLAAHRANIQCGSPNR